jgi:hypothetical protein
MNKNLFCHTKGHKTSATENPILSKISLSHLKLTHSLSLPLTPLSLSLPFITPTDPSHHIYSSTLSLAFSLFSPDDSKAYLSLSFSLARSRWTRSPLAFSLLSPLMRCRPSPPSLCSSALTCPLTFSSRGVPPTLDRVTSPDSALFSVTSHDCALSAHL